MNARRSLADYATVGSGWPRQDRARPATPKGSFVVARRPIAGRRIHLPAEAVTVWRRGRLTRLAVRTLCGNYLSAVTVEFEAPDEHELCDACVLADLSPTVYRIFDDRDQLLYVGCTANLVARLSTHTSQSDWWPLAATVTFEHHPDINVALAAESAAILAERPLFNRDLTVRARLRGRRPTDVVRHAVRVMERAA